VIELHGNRSKLSKDELEARREEEVKARPLRPDPPKDLTPLERECWNLHAPELERLALLSVLDAGSFRFACASYALAITALGEMRPRKADGSIDARKKGYIVTEVDRVHGGMLKKHPAFAIYAQAVRDYRSWCVEFGLTPSARLGLRPGAQPPLPGADEHEDDDEFFGT
jgi:P27 family predicted phage terminase small subunit